MHKTSQYIKNILGNILPAIGDISHSKNELLVLNYHGTPKKFISNFKKQLEYFEKIFEIVGPKELNLFYRGDSISTSKPMLLFTFDDGIKNNLYAAEILLKKNYKAYYFIIPGFIETEIFNQKKYYSSNIRPSVDILTHSQEDDFIPMDWRDLASLISLGNCIGSHSYTHKLNAELSSEINSQHEIIDSKTIIEKKLASTTVNSFCSPNNTLLSIEKKEMEMIKNNYQFHFSTIPGSNFIKKNKYFIRRSNVETYWLSGAIKYNIGKTDWTRWKKEENLFNSICDF